MRVEHLDEKLKARIIEIAAGGRHCLAVSEAKIDKQGLITP